MIRFNISYFSEGYRKTSVVRLHKYFIKSHVPGSEMKFIAVEKQVSVVFRHVMFCVFQAETFDKIFDLNIEAYKK